MSQSVEPRSSIPEKKTISDKLLVEIILEETAQADWLISDLPHWLPPEKVELYLTQAAKPVSDTKWFFHEPRIYAETIGKRQRLVREISEQTARALKSAGFPVQTNALNVISDEGCHRLLEDVNQEPRELLVIGSTLPPSSFSLCLARHAPCPVLLLRAPLKSRIGRLVTMLATDGSEAAATAASRLPDLVQAAHLSVTAVTVYQHYYLQTAIEAAYVNIPAMEQALEENALMTLDITRALLEEKGVHVLDCVHLAGNPAHELLRLAKEKIDPDLIVVGAHNRSALSSWLLGSVSQRLLHDAPYNLLIVR